MSLGLIVSFTGVIVAGLAGMLGVWMDRGPESSLPWAVFFSGLIALSSGVEIVQTGVQNIVDSRTDSQMADLLITLSELSEHNPELQEFVAAELAVQARANPEMVHKLEKKVAAKGGDPKVVRQMADKGRRNPPKTEPPKAKKQDVAEKKPETKPDPKPDPAAQKAAEDAAKALADANAAVAAANAKAAAVLGAANEQAAAITQQAEQMKAQAEAVKQQADAAMAQAKQVQDQADAALKKAQGALDSVPKVADLPSLGGKGKGKGKSKGPKLPGF